MAEQQRVDNFIMQNQSKFPDGALGILRSKLLEIDDSQFDIIISESYKDVNTSIVLSALVGSLGVDRFYVGDTTLGVLKLVTCGGAGIWWLVDLFLIMGIVKQKNLEILQRYI